MNPILYIITTIEESGIYSIFNTIQKHAYININKFNYDLIIYRVFYLFIYSIVGWWIFIFIEKLYIWFESDSYNIYFYFKDRGNKPYMCTFLGQQK